MFDATTTTERKMTMTAAIKRHRVVLLLCVLAQAGLGVLATRGWLLSHNTLQANGRWISTKTIVERGLMGAFAYITERNALAGGQLNLHPWHGYNEVILAQPLGVVKTIEFDFALIKGGWIVAGFNRSDQEREYDAVRLSATEHKPSSCLRITTDGKFVSKQPLESVTFTEGYHRARIELDGTTMTLDVDGVRQGEFPAASLAGQKISFHGGLRPAGVDNILVTNRDGTTLEEDFNSPPASRWLMYVVIAAAIAFNGFTFLLLCWVAGADDRFLGFKMLMISITLLVVAAVLNDFVVKKATWYPELDTVLAQAEAYFQKGAISNVMAEIDARHERGPHESFRILFLGASQTWGAGALRDEDVWVRRLERILGKRADGGRRIECINAGISSSRAADFTPLLRDQLLQFEPNLVVINLSSNDRGEPFADTIRDLATQSLEAGARVVLVKEANEYTAYARGLIARHRELDTVAAELGIGVIDMHRFMLRKDEKGLLWWDKVHMTSFGQQLMAEEMARRLRQRGLLEAVAATAGQ